MESENLKIAGINTKHEEAGVRDQLSEYLEYVSKIPVLSEEEERELCERMKKKDKEAVDKLIKHNLRFVVNIAQRYKHSDVSLMDLINEGNLGLIYAAKKFDPDKNVKFLSYAAWWIKNYIIKYLVEQSGPIKVPIKTKSKIKKLENVKNLYFEKFNRSPLTEELSRATNMSEREIKKVNEFRYRVDSLDRNLTDDPDNYYSPTEILSSSTESLEDHYIKESMIEDVKRILDELPERERNIIVLRYGLIDGKKRTLQEIGEMYNISKERVRQLENETIRKIRKKLRGYR